MQSKDSIFLRFLIMLRRKQDAVGAKKSLTKEKARARMQMQAEKRKRARLNEN